MDDQLIVEFSNPSWHSPPLFHAPLQVYLVAIKNTHGRQRIRLTNYRDAWPLESLIGWKCVHVSPEPVVNAYCRSKEGGEPPGCKPLNPQDTHTSKTSLMLTNSARLYAEKCLLCLILLGIPIRYSPVLLANGSVPGALLHVLIHGRLPSEMLCVETLKVKTLQIPVLSFPFGLWQLSPQHGLLRVLLRRHFFPVTEQFWRNQGSKPVRTHMMLARYRSPTAVKSAFSVEPGLNIWCKLLGGGHTMVSGFQIIRAPSLGLMNGSN